MQSQVELANGDKDQFDKLFEDKFVNKYPQWFWEAICDYEAGIVNSMREQSNLQCWVYHY
jgi:hypothetical protein